MKRNTTKTSSSSKSKSKASIPSQSTSSVKSSSNVRKAVNQAKSKTVIAIESQQEDPNYVTEDKPSDDNDPHGILEDNSFDSTANPANGKRIGKLPIKSFGEKKSAGSKRKKQVNRLV